MVARSPTLVVPFLARVISPASVVTSPSHQFTIPSVPVPHSSQDTQPTMSVVSATPPPEYCPTTVSALDP